MMALKAQRTVPARPYIWGSPNHIYIIEKSAYLKATSQSMIVLVVIRCKVWLDRHVHLAYILLVVKMIWFKNQAYYVYKLRM